MRSYLELLYDACLDMELLKILYFLILGVYALQCWWARKLVLSWPLILAAVSLHAFYFFRWPGLVFLLVTAVVSTLAELISLKSPFNVFGVSYKYDLRHELFPSGLVLAKIFPIEVTAAWVLLKYLSLFLANFLLAPLGIHWILKALIEAFILLSYDFILDPYCVSDGAWKWSHGGFLFKIPWQNFLGWYLLGFGLSLSFSAIQPIAFSDVTMIAPVVVVSALFPTVLGGRLLAQNKVQALLAMAPLIVITTISVIVMLRLA